MKDKKMPFMGGTVAAIVIIVLLVIMSKSFGGTQPKVTNVEPTERATMEFLPNTEIVNLPTE